MKNVLIAFVCLCPLFSFGQPQTAWVRTWNYNFSSATNTPAAMRLDGKGNIYLGASARNAAGDLDYLVLKYAPDGTELWQARYASPEGGKDEMRAMALESNGNVVLTGTSVTVKYSESGELLWVADYGGRDVVCSTGVVYAVGASEVDFSTAKFDLETGTNIWTRIKDWVGGPDIARKVAFDDSGAVYVFGECAYRCDGPPGCYMINALLFYDAAGTLKGTQEVYFSRAVRQSQAVALEIKANSVLTLSQQLDDAYSYMLHAYGVVGAKLWGWDESNNGYWPPGYSSALVVDSKNAAIAAGTTVGPGQVLVNYMTTLKISSGQKIWHSSYPNPTTGKLYNRGYSLAIDKQDNVFVAGVCELQLGKRDMVTIKYSNDGQERWVKHYNGPANGEDRALAIAVAPDDSIYVAGYSATAEGGTEMVLIKYVEPRVNATPKTSGDVQIQMNGVPGSRYAFQSSGDLQTWLSLSTNTTDATGQATFTDTNASNLYPFRFYRSLLLP